MKQFIVNLLTYHKSKLEVSEIDPFTPMSHEIDY
jgi:hypothetical protein